MSESMFWMTHCVGSNGLVGQVVPRSLIGWLAAKARMDHGAREGLGAPGARRMVVLADPMNMVQCCC